jgi:8-oxo-dGTP pyrophosphatase MutT (NUDIX family)
MRKARKASTSRSAVTTREQVSAGGVAFRREHGRLEIALIAVESRGAPRVARWQLPKGLVDTGETPEAAAVREVREEAGLVTEVLARIETIEYWYVGTEAGCRVRYHKFVHFFLLAWQSGDVSDHDEEVLEARWVPIGDALELLAFDNERRVVARARDMISAITAS